jgi:hypothetical protein
MIVFLHVPKTGGTTFRFILENNFGLSNCHTNQTRKALFTQADFDFAQRFFPRLRSIAGHNLIDPAHLKIPGAFHMTFMREPVARVLSHYQDSVLRGNSTLSFEEALRSRGDLFCNHQVKLMAGGPDLDKAKFFLEKHCGFIGFTETFDRSLQVLDRLSPYKLDLRYKRKVVARNDRVKKEVASNPAAMEMAREMNRLDLELYAFALNEVFPRLCERAGIRPADPVESFEKYTRATQPKYLIGRFYNKLFRQVYKLRTRNAGDPGPRNDSASSPQTHTARK